MVTLARPPPSESVAGRTLDSVPTLLAQVRSEMRRNGQLIVAAVAATALTVLVPANTMAQGIGWYATGCDPVQCPPPHVWCVQGCIIWCQCG